MEKISTNNKSSIEEIHERFNKQKINKQVLLLEKREETHDKFQDIKKILRESIHISKIITNITDELKFDVKYMSKPNYGYYLFFVFSIVIASSAIWKLDIIYSNIKFFSIPLIFIFILVNCIALYITSHIRKRKTYKKYINNCKDTNINNEDIIQLISKLLDNNLIIANMIPKEFFSYFIKEYYKTDLDIYIDFLCKNTKSLMKKCKNKKLHLYKGRYSRNMSILLEIEDIENNHFQSKFSNPAVDTIEECVKRFLKYKY
jgi:hypothetical protein